MHAFHPHWTCSGLYTACAQAPTLTASTHLHSGLLPFSPFQLGTQRLCLHLLQDGQPGLTPMACQGIDTGGPWSVQEKTYHINCLELLAATLALKTFMKNKTGLLVLLKIDNTTAVAYINNQGGTVSKTLVTLTKELWMWCLERNIHIQAQLLPGVLNCRADMESRSLKDRSDWSLDRETFIKINELE